ncbi:Adenine phosphoribosyltransferase [Eumeta japonica]|uniref:Adenine phosphoribosyltransferase n=1 Tax=Eumeta variegata TaxID=151549 RepID=A0A4C1V1F1_EUMVA|nr:Adenine phosphoribosyltransferase [Eumeta japonica]
MDNEFENKISELRSKIMSFPDFPKKGILFWDIFSAVADGRTCKLLQSLLVDYTKKNFPDVEAIVGLESRGFLFSFSIAAELGVSCLPVRKKGKLPGDVLSYAYELEYGSDILEIQRNHIRPGMRCVIVDDLIATGGSLNAAIHLLKSCGADVIGCFVIIELPSLKGRSKIPNGIPVHSLMKLD